MYNFKNDYSEGAHPKILEALFETNLEQAEGYGEDRFSKEARDLIQEKVGDKEVDVHFVSGGTQANLICLSSILKSYESVVSVESGHINGHEAGAIELTGHKINLIKGEAGKIKIEEVKQVIEEHQEPYDHLVKPKVVFISNSTEIGTIYSKKELEEISQFCKENNLFLYLDGARLGSALTSSKNDLILADIARLTDIFYIGGTKNGALLGEAIVISNENLKENFRIYMKQRGALLAKGRLIGLQFRELFKDDLFFKTAKHANLMAEKLTKGIKALGYNFLSDSSSNQIFPIFPNSLIEKLQQDFGFFIWQKIDKNNSAIRLVTSWATKEKEIDRFIELINKHIIKHDGLSGAEAINKIIV
jgi:threonine aldolase